MSVLAFIEEPVLSMFRRRTISQLLRFVMTTSAVGNRLAVTPQLVKDHHIKMITKMMMWR